jgi:hypothetical protein
MSFSNGPCDCADPTKVHEIWAYVAEDAAGEEGIIAYPTAMGVMPLLGADRQRVASLRRFAEAAARERGTRVELRRFHLVESQIDIIEPS